MAIINWLTCGTKYNATIQCNVTSEGASIAKCDNITTEIDSKLISYGSLYCRTPPFTKGKGHNYLKTSRELSCVQIHVKQAIGCVTY